MKGNQNVLLNEFIPSYLLEVFVLFGQYVVQTHTHTHTHRALVPCVIFEVVIPLTEPELLGYLLLSPQLVAMELGGGNDTVYRTCSWTRLLG